MRSIYTSRLVIRPVCLSDLADICEYGCDTDTGKYMIYWPKTEEEIKMYIEASSAAMASKPAGTHKLALQLKSSEKVIGHISLEPKEEQWEIAWVMNQAYRNKGYVTEAALAVIDFAQQYLNADRIFATCAKANIASYRVMEKCGMTKVKEEQHCRSIKQGKEVEFDRLTYSIEKKK